MSETAKFFTDGEMEEAARKKKEQENGPQRLRHNTFAKRKRPTGFNGIHRRRNKRAAPPLKKRCMKASGRWRSPGSNTAKV